MWISLIDTVLPVAAMPISSPVCVPEVTWRMTTLSPSAIRSSVLIARSLNAPQDCRRDMLEPFLAGRGARHRHVVDEVSGDELVDDGVVSVDEQLLGETLHDSLVGVRH